MWFFENLLIPAGWVGQATIGWDGFLKIPACQGARDGKPCCHLMWDRAWGLLSGVGWGMESPKKPAHCHPWLKGLVLP